MRQLPGIKIALACVTVQAGLTQSIAQIDADDCSVGASCLAAAQEFYRLGNFEEARPRFEAACDAKIEQGCAGLARMVELHETRAADYPFAKGLFLAACQDGESFGCLYAASMLERGDGGAQDLNSARDLYDQGCKRVGGEVSCFKLALMYAGGKLGHPDPTRARALLVRSCAYQHVQSCLSLASMVARGEGGPVDLAYASNLFQALCDWGNAEGCHSLGASYLSGRGLPVDRARATQLFERSCGLGEVDACSAVKLMEKDQRSVEERR